MIRRRIVSAATRIQRADVALIRAKRRTDAAYLARNETNVMKEQAKEEQIQEARDFYERKCLDLEAAEIGFEEADKALDRARRTHQEAFDAEARAHKALTKLEKEQGS